MTDLRDERVDHAGQGSIQDRAGGHAAGGKISRLRIACHIGRAGGIHRARNAPIDRHAGDSADVASKPDPAYRRPGESERRGPGTSRYPGAGGAVADSGIGLLIESHQSLGGERYGVKVTVLSVLVEAVFPLPAAS